MPAAQPAERVVKTTLRPHQWKALDSDRRIVFAGCGVGSGKTHVGGLKVVQWAAESPPGVSHIIAANTYTQLFDSTLENLYKNLTAWGVQFKPDKLPETASSYGPWNLYIWGGTRWVLFRCRSLVKYAHISGQECGCFWIDEAWDAPEEGYKVVLARRRDKRMAYNQGLITTTLDDPNSWMYRVFVEGQGGVNDSGQGEHWHWSESARQLSVYATTWANEGNLGEGYVEDLLASMSEREAQRMLKAEWVALATGRIYHAFSRQDNVTEEAEYDPALPIRWAHDFNIGQDKPMSSCLFQLKKVDGKPVMDIFDELILDSTDTQDAIDERLGREWECDPGAEVIYGDASGRSKDTRSKTTDYGIIRDAGFTEQKVPKKNPPIRTRHNIVNARLKSADGTIGLRVHPRCSAIIKGGETVRLRKGAQYLEEETREQHVWTAIGYACCVEFPERGRVKTQEFWY